MKFGLVLSLAVLLSGCSWLPWRMQQGTADQAISPSPVEQAIYNQKLRVDLEYNAENQTIDVYARSNQQIPVTSFSLLVTFESTDGLESGDLIASPTLVTRGWTFPVSGVALNSDGTASVKLAGIIIGEGLFETNQLLASVPISPEADVAVLAASIDQLDTKFYTRDMHQVLLESYGSTSIQ